MHMTIGTPKIRSYHLGIMIQSERSFDLFPVTPWGWSLLAGKECRVIDICVPILGTHPLPRMIRMILRIPRDTTLKDPVVCCYMFSFFWFLISWLKWTRTKRSTLDTLGLACKISENRPRVLGLESQVRTYEVTQNSKLNVGDLEIQRCRGAGTEPDIDIMILGLAWVSPPGSGQQILTAIWAT